MYKVRAADKTTIRTRNYQVGETIETKMERVLNNKEPISEGAPLIYTERKEGIPPETNIRTDRMEVAVNAIDKATKTSLAKRAEALKAAQDADNQPKAES